VVVTGFWVVVGLPGFWVVVGWPGFAVVVVVGAAVVVVPGTQRAAAPLPPPATQIKPSQQTWLPSQGWPSSRQAGGPAVVVVVVVGPAVVVVVVVGPAVVVVVVVGPAVVVVVVVGAAVVVVVVGAAVVVVVVVVHPLIAVWAQVPSALQVSTVQALLSSQQEASLRQSKTLVQPASGSQPSVVQTSESSQLTRPLLSQIPVTVSQVSTVQRSPSSQLLVVQTHDPPEQAGVVPLQTVAQAPQWLTSLLSSTHNPLQLVWPLVQQTPLEQVSPLGQATAVSAEQPPVVVSQVPATWHWSEAEQTTGLPPVQTPAWQVSVWVQASPSSQVVPLTAIGLEQAPVAWLQVPATWHWSDAVQTTGLPPVQTPAWQVSVWVQASPSSQGVPSFLAGLEQTPVSGSQSPAVWHWSGAGQITGLLPVQTPLWHVSVWVQALPSPQAEPSVLAGLVHLPVSVSQTPATWHWSEAVQMTGSPPVHVPAWQVSVCVQALPSLQVVPSVLGAYVHLPVPVSQIPGSWHWSGGSQTVGVPEMQVPPVQTSPTVQALPSLQVVPSVALGFEHLPVVVSQVPATWHWSEAVQITGLLPTQVPLWHVSVWVQALPSLQVAPSVALGLEQIPVPVSHVPATWHWSDAVQTFAAPAWQEPAWQVSPIVQALPSSQGVLLALAGLEQTPVVVSQVPAVWHWSGAGQTTGLLPVQVPAWQVSVWVQALPSLQVVPSAALGLEQMPVVVSQVPATWHWSEAVQTTGFPPVQTPATQVSVWVQALPSSQVVPSAFCGLVHSPVPGMHVPASWHWSGVGQTTGLPPTHLPAWQVSVWVQALPSLQAVLFATGTAMQVPSAGLQVPVLHRSVKPEQSTGGPPTQTPAWHASSVVQARSSLQDVPSDLFGFEQAPVAGSQVPTSWHWSSAVQVTGVPLQTPAVQTSPVVHLLPSSQEPPSLVGILSQKPVLALQTPVLQLSVKDEQSVGVPVQFPAPSQMSRVVQALPSLQGVPASAGGLEQAPVPGLQVPATWHWSSAVQVTGLKPTQIPPWQMSVWVQAFPSSQVAPSLPGAVPHVPLLQVATKHGLAGVEHVPHVSVPPQPSGADPQCWPAGQVVAGVQPQTPGVPPPPHVCGATQGAGRQFVPQTLALAQQTPATQVEVPLTQHVLFPALPQQPAGQLLELQAAASASCRPNSPATAPAAPPASPLITWRRDAPVANALATRSKWSPSMPLPPPSPVLRPSRQCWDESDARGCPHAREKTRAATELTGCACTPSVHNPRDPPSPRVRMKRNKKLAIQVAAPK
jgi:hypothetical protein